MTLDESKEALRKEYQLFQSQRGALLEQNPGMYVLFRDGQTQGFYKTYNEAYEAGLEKYGFDDAYLIEHLKEQTPGLPSTWELGLIYVGK